MYIFLTTLLILSFNVSAKVYSKDGFNKLVCEKPKSMSNGDLIVDQNKIRITLYASSDNKTWFKLKTSKNCIFKIKSLKLSSGKIFFSVSATYNKVESRISNVLEINIINDENNKLNNPKFFEAKI